MKLVARDQTVFEINLPTMKIGRDSNNDIVIPDTTVSGLHAYIQQQGNDYLIWDAGSTNGTFVNSIKLTGSYILKPNDQILFGSYPVAVLDDYTPASQASFGQTLVGVNQTTVIDQSQAAYPPEIPTYPKTQYGPQPILPTQPSGQPYGQYYNAPTYSTATKDRSLALVLEILPGLFGFLGIGWIYSGQVGTGIGWLIGYLVYLVISIIIDVATGGLGVICTLPISITIIVISVVTLNTFTKKHPELYKP